MRKIRRRELIKGAAGAAIMAAVPGSISLFATERPSMSRASASGYFGDKFGVDEGVLRRTIALAMCKGGDYAEVFLQHKISDSVTFEDGHVNHTSVSVDLGAGIRVLQGSQTGYAYSEDLSERSLLAAANTAASIASGTAAPGPSGFKSVKMPDLYDRRPVWLGVPPEQKVKLTQTVGEKIQAADPSVVNASVQFGNSDEVIFVANSLGEIVEDTRPMTALFATCVAEKNGRRETNRYRCSARCGMDYYTPSRIDHIAKEAVRTTLLLFDAVSPPAGEMPVVLAPGTSGIILHEAMGHGFEADFNRKGISIFSTLMGKKVAENFVTILDTALEPAERGSINVDDEGTPGRRTVLVENGKLVSYLHDRISARHFNVEPTGNGRRQSFRHVPMPRMRVTTMENGPHDPEEIIKSVKRGLYAVDFANGQVMIGAGDYSFYLKTGYLIENGKLTRPVKDANLIGNGPDSLSKMVMVGNDQALGDHGGTCGKEGQWVPVGFGLPTVKVSGITIGGTS